MFEGAPESAGDGPAPCAPPHQHSRAEAVKVTVLHSAPEPACEGPARCACDLLHASPLLRPTRPRVLTLSLLLQVHTQHVQQRQIANDPTDSAWCRLRPYHPNTCNAGDDMPGTVLGPKKQVGAGSIELCPLTVFSFLALVMFLLFLTAPQSATLPSYSNSGGQQQRRTAAAAAAVAVSDVSALCDSTPVSNLAKLQQR